MRKEDSMANRGVAVKVEGKKVVFTVDLTKGFGPSASGKTIIVATTGGAEEIAPGIFANITIYSKVGK